MIGKPANDQVAGNKAGSDDVVTDSAGTGSHGRRLMTVAELAERLTFELEIDAAIPAEAERVAAEAAAKLLANPVIESYRIEVDAAAHAEMVR